MLILLSGFGTKKQSFRSVLRPEPLATVGIVTTALITGCVHLLVPKVPALYALLVPFCFNRRCSGFPSSRAKNGFQTQDSHRTGIVANDPMAIVLTLFVIGLILLHRAEF